MSIIPAEDEVDLKVNNKPAVLDVEPRNDELNEKSIWKGSHHDFLIV